MRQKTYTVGKPCWTVFASWGYTLKISVSILWDGGAQRFVATSKSLRGLVCEANTREQIEEDIAAAVELLLPRQFASGFKPPYFTELHVEQTAISTGDYFGAVVGRLKAKEYRYVGKGEGGFEVWRRKSRHVIVPLECKSHQAARGVMKAAGIYFFQRYFRRASRPHLER